MASLDKLDFSNSFARLGEAFFARVQPTPLENPHLISFSPAVAELLDIDPQEFQRADIAEYFAGVRLPSGSEPLAMLYSGHQFGHYVPQLGDGRAILLGEIRNHSGEKWELQLKGAGLTPFSRDGDGRAVLRSTIREYLCSEAMAGLGIPTTRALCITGSNEEVYREQIETGAMLLRVAPSHIRFGSFEVFFYRGQYHHLKLLADFVIENHYPELLGTVEPYAGLLQQVVLKTASLMAQWQLVGFAHGVMNTDNMSVLGLTLDYGPFGFLDAYDADIICNHSDHHGRYAFSRQPQIGLWNLTCFAQTLLPLLNSEDGEAAAARANDILQQYEPELVRCYASGLRAKLGLQEPQDGDQSLAAGLLELMQQNRVDYSNAFRFLSGFSLAQTPVSNRFRDLFADRPAVDAWLDSYRQRLLEENSQDESRQRRMRRVNPKYILRNYLAQQAIEAAEQQDFSEIEQLLAVLSRPFDEHVEFERYAAPPPEDLRQIAISCSS